MTLVTDNEKRVILRHAKTIDRFDVRIADNGKYILTKLEPIEDMPYCMRCTLYFRVSILLLVMLALASGVTGCRTGSSQRACQVCGAKMLSAKKCDFDADSLDSFTKAFHHYGIHAHAEIYLISIYHVQKGERNRVEIEATVVEQIKRHIKAGEKMVFNRILEEETTDAFATRMLGGLFYVMADMDAGKTTVDPQDPSALWKYDEDLRHMVERHKSICSGHAN